MSEGFPRCKDGNELNGVLGHGIYCRLEISVPQPRQNKLIKLHVSVLAVSYVPRLTADRPPLGRHWINTMAKKIQACGSTNTDAACAQLQCELLIPV